MLHKELLCIFQTEICGYGDLVQVFGVAMSLVRQRESSQSKPSQKSKYS